MQHLCKPDARVRSAVSSSSRCESFHFLVSVIPSLRYRLFYYEYRRVTLSFFSPSRPRYTHFSSFFLIFFYPRSVCCVSHCVYTASFCVRVFPSNSHADVVTTNIFAPRERKRERESERKKCSGFALSFSRCLFIRAIGRRRFLASPGRLSPSGRKYLLLSLTFVVCIYSVVSHFGDYGKLSLPLSSTSFSSFSLASGLSFP